MSSADIKLEVPCIRRTYMQGAEGEDTHQCPYL